MIKAVNNEYLTIDAADYFQHLIKDINQARKTIECEAYILEDDDIGTAVLNALSEASERGVKVRLMIDGFGSSPWINFAIQKLQKHNGEVRIYHPMPWHFWQWGLAINREAFLKKLTYLFTVINRRNHRKICIIDRYVHWLGSFNLTKVHLNKKMGGGNWRDTAVRIETENTEALQAFNKIWSRKHFSSRRLEHNFPNFFRINDSRRKRRRLYRDLLSHITRADKRIWITTPYFVPEPRFLKRLKRTAQRGTDVCILLPSVSDVFFMPWVSSLLYVELLNAGIKVYEYNAGILHAKTLMADNWVTIGSSNMNSRSIFHDLEIDYVLQNKDSIKTIENHFIDDLEQSTQICLDDIKKRNPIITLLGRIILYLRYWL